jgi:hypothetical protein
VKTLKERIEDNSIPCTECGCWLWTGRTKGHGYGQLWKARGKTWLAHRVSYAAFVGPIPKGMFVCHKCDTPSCVNPSHLFLGTHSDNMRDSCAKGRRDHIKPPTYYGEAHPNTTLTAVQVREIRASERKSKELAAIYNVTQWTINNIRSGKTWRFV